MTEPRLQLVETLSDATREAVCAPLRDYNHAHNAAFFHSRDLPHHAPQSLNVLAYDELGNMIGGLLATTQFAWLKIDIMSVVDAWRRRGVGSRLLAAAEASAIERGCRYSFLDTMSYQAPDFYSARGYQVAGQLDNWDSHGHVKFLFVKRLEI